MNRSTRRAAPVDHTDPHAKAMGRDQHLLIDNDAISHVMEAARLDSGDIVLDIGGGAGALTARIAPAVSHVYVMEIDRRFEPDLSRLARDCGNISVIWEDFRSAPWPKQPTIVANPPFGLLEQLVSRMTNESVPAATLVLGSNAWTQLERAHRGDYGRFSLLTLPYFDVTHEGDIPPGAFQPRPRTAAVILRFVLRTKRDRALARLGDALRRHGDRRVREFVWHLSRADSDLAARLNASDRVRTLWAHRLQALTDADLSTLVAEITS